MPEVTKEEFDKAVRQEARDVALEAVTSIFKPSEERADDVAFQEVKNILDGEIQEKVTESLEKAQRKASKRNGHPTGVVKMFPGGKGVEGGVEIEPVEGAEKLWQLRDLTGPQTVKIGRGRLAATTLFYAGKVFHSEANLNWKNVASLAEERHPEVSGMIRKNLETGDLSAGGSLLPTEMSQDLITFLFASTVARQMGAMTVDLSSGQLDFGKITGSVSATWVGETGTINASNISTGNVTLSKKKLKIVSILSNDIVRQAPQGIENIVQRHLRQQAGLAEDKAIFKGAGSNNEPKGIDDWINANNQFSREQASSADGSTLQEIVRTAVTCIDLLVRNNHNLDEGRPGWVMHPTDKHGIMSELDGEDRSSALAEELSNQQFYGYPVRTTTNIWSDVSATNRDLYFGDFSQLIIGETLDMRIDSTTEATVTDSSGSSVDLFDEDQRAMRIIHEMDSALMRDTAFARVDSVDYGSDKLVT